MLLFLIITTSGVVPNPCPTVAPPEPPLEKLFPPPLKDPPLLYPDEPPLLVPPIDDLAPVPILLRPDLELP